MIEVLQDFLIRQGMATDLAEDIDIAYYNGQTEQGEKDNVRKVVEDNMNDTEHDYIDEVFDLVRLWQYEVNEKVWA